MQVTTDCFYSLSLSSVALFLPVPFKTVGRKVMSFTNLGLPRGRVESVWVGVWMLMFLVVIFFLGGRVLVGSALVVVREFFFFLFFFSFLQVSGASESKFVPTDQAVAI